MAKKKVTAAEKAGDKVRVAADWIKQKRKKLDSWQVPDTVHYDELKVEGELDLDKSLDFLEKLLVWLAENVKSGAKLSGKTLLWMMEYLTRAIGVVTVDNAVLRKFEKVIADSKLNPKPKSGAGKAWKTIKKFSKNNPWIMSYVMYYMLSAGIIFGGVKGVQAIADKDTDDSKNKVVLVQEEDEAGDADAAEFQPIEEIEDQGQPEDIGVDEVSYVDVQQSVEHVNVVFGAQSVDPNLSTNKYAKAALEQYWPEIAVGLTELETYNAKSKRHDREARETNGLGCTYHYYYNDAGELVRYENRLGWGVEWSRDKNYEQCRRHLLYETLPSLKFAVRGKQNIGAQQEVALVLAGYQRPSDMAGIAQRISNAKTVQQMADAFAYYPGPQKWRDGTLRRRWICAAYAVGAISAQDLLHMDRDAFSTVNINNVYRNGHFLLGPQTVSYVLSRTRSTGDVKDFLDDFETGRDILSRISSVSGQATFALYTDEEQQAEMQVIEASMKLMNDGDKEFRNGQYAKAAALYKKAIEADKDNMQAYSSLAFAYKKLGDLHKSISYYEMSAQAVKDGNARMNANKHLLLDREIKASSYYNAGTAREEIAKLYEAQGDKTKAIKNYDLALKNYKTALDNAEMDGLDQARKDVYSAAINRVQKKIATMKMVAMNTGVKKIRQENARKDLLLYGTEHKGNVG